MGKVSEGELMAALRSPAAKKSAKPVAAVKVAPKTGKGKPINLYLHPEDQLRIRSLAAYLVGQGKRVSDSQVVKAALQVAGGNAELLTALHAVAERDMRFKKPEDAKG